MYVRELIRTHIPTASPEMSLQEVLDIMDIHQLVLVPIVRHDGTLLGTFGEENIERLLKEPSDTSAQQNDIALLINRDIPVLKEESSVEEAIGYVQRHGCHRLVVVDDKGKVVGLVSIVDIYRAKLGEKNARE
ncbi:CBS domain-containing protein [Chthonomonas calidirosea]|uniref:Predicted transcriptional regulator, contains C-terminal CBS domains n=1 Tax=Chthonomonas calidirosea (strain DSM 23976 / ICMP 18418 / T49) TaxID=1303518 RepID=S0ESH9_CHTCT|nr:CBS domain-containing protein [Chthonomonas calidirosea]CCW34251.1 Predicted transcriptional regulator, contains C-terminal CBS domains [Chthonomonas calidirosea T49]CEK14146.1 predicted transcriptional regulator, contains C-terminal CBS domains [Chthonomonas calidirosea]CEK15319.1 predicted transcriptional regulator, contains C-terminal CBS domains [Chthonomonas calidirosea]